MSLSNGAEHFAGETWRTHFPDEGEPPLWVEHMLLHGDRAMGPALVLFETGPDYELTDYDMRGITAEQLEALVGEPVDVGRGEQQPRQRTEPEYLDPPFRVETVSWRLQPRPFRTGCMATTPPWWRRLLPGRASATRDCCWYHAGSWKTVNRTAARLLAAHQHPDPDEVMGAVLAAAHREGITGWELEALESPFEAPIYLATDTEGEQLITNGQHRIRAMLDSGATRTVVQREEPSNRGSVPG
ncbi:hypothetical protein [Amycolatopsis minnesotensis]